VRRETLSLGGVRHGAANQRRRATDIVVHHKYPAIEHGDFRDAMLSPRIIQPLALLHARDVLRVDMHEIRLSERVALEASEFEQHGRGL